MLPSSTKLQERLLEQFRQQRGRGLDFTLHSNDGREFRVHSAVLESASPYLCDLLGDTEEPAVTLPTIGGGELEACIEYMYGAAPRLDGVDTEALAKAADYLCLDGLVDPILSPTVLSPAGLTDVTKLIETYYRWQHKQDVRAPVYAAMLRSFASLAAQASWLEAPEELVEALLGSSRLVVRSEGVALEALLTWLRAPRDVPPTPETTARLLSLVRMPPLFGAQQAAERDRALSAAVPRRAPAGEDEAQWLRLLFDAIFEATPWEPLGQPRHAALARRLRELGLTDTDERLRAWLRDAGSGQRPSLVAAARAESLFDNAPCLKVTLERAMAARAPAERLGSGRLYAVGGSEGNGNHLSSVERFDPEAGCWEEVADMSHKRDKLGVAELNDQLYAVGGHNGDGYLSSVERFDPDVGTWEEVAAMRSKRNGPGVAVLDNKLYAVGGYDGNDDLSTVERFDPQVGAWEEVAGMRSKRGGLPGVAVLGGRLYAFGGYNGNEFLSSVERFDPLVGAWEDVAAMGTKRNCLGVAVLGGTLYAVGGSNGNGDLATVERFHPEAGVWEEVAGMRSKRGYLGVAVLGSKLYAVGGYNGNGDYLSSVERFDPEAGHWEEVSGMKSERGFLGVAVL